MTTLLKKLTTPALWRKSLIDVLLWFLFGTVVTMLLTQFSPGYPIVVGTASIPRGLYWVTKAEKNYQRYDYTSFKFMPSQAWLQGYDVGTMHTKEVIGIPGDVVRADKAGRLSICHEGTCISAGIPLTKGARGTPLHAWLRPGTQYVLQEGEIWVYGSHERSLDSRYHGPIQAKNTQGKATPLFLID